MNAKEIVKNKFWIVQDKGQNIGTISFNDEQYMLSDASGSRFFTDTNDLEKTLQTSVSWQQLEIKESKPTKEVNTFPTSTHPYNSMFDVKRKLPLFTKSKKSKSLYCAGYYIIKFEKGWVRSYCPKLLTLERYPFKGPFRTILEMKTELANANKRTD